jgi:hypothetical protein
LQLNGYDHHRMTPAQSAETLTELLKISHDEFEYEAKMVDHTKEEFKKYAYQYGKGTDRTNTRTERDTLSADTLWTEKDTKALGDFDPNLGIRIKVENKDLDKVQGMVTVLRSANTVLKKLLDNSGEIQLKLVQKGNLESHSVAFDVQIQELAAFVKGIRKDVVTYENADADNQDLVIIAEQLRKQKDAAMAHQEGMKMSIKRYKAMV